MWLRKASHDPDLDSVLIQKAYMNLDIWFVTLGSSDDSFLAQMWIWILHTPGCNSRTIGQIFMKFVFKCVCMCVLAQG